MNGEKCIIGIDIGGTNFRIGALTDSGRELGFRKLPVRSVINTEDVLGDLASFIREDFLSSLGSECEPEALCIGFPATLDRARKTVLQAPNVPFMEMLPVVDYLEESLRIPVFIDRDVNMALVYDADKYSKSSCELISGIYFGTGIGNAIMMEGRLLKGRHGTLGELGHIPVYGSDEECGCGNRGCMESLAGGKYLARIREDYFSDTELGDIFDCHWNHPLMLEFVDRMAITVATELNILDPDCLFVGGGVPCMKGFPTQFLFDRIKSRTRKPYPADSLSDILIFAGDEEDKCVKGAAIMGFGRLKGA